MNKMKFSQKVKEALKYYVYVLIDPRTNKIFYVGKGQDDRVFAHVKGALKQSSKSDKLDTIRDIKKSGQPIKHYILRHGIEKEETAYILESVLIDFLTFKDFSSFAAISNIAAGHHSFDRGIKTTEECETLYNCKELKLEKVRDKILIININKTYNNGKKKTKYKNTIYDRPDIYNATRGWWRLNKDRAEKADYVFAEYKGIVRAVFKPNKKWLQDKNRGNKRWGFEGVEVKEDKVLELYLNKSVPKKHGQANPIRYINIK